MGMTRLFNVKASLRVVSVALAMLLALPAVSIAPAHAESENPLWLWNKKNKQKKAKTDAAAELKFEDDHLPSASNWQNSASGGKATTVTEIVSSENISPMLSPVGSIGLQAALSRYQAIVAAGGWPTVPDVKLRKGAEGEAVAALNRRLFVEGYVRREATEGEFAAVFTTATAEALSRFQRNHGLKVSGTLDSATAKALNVPAARRLATIRANIPRLDEYSRDVGPRYIIVNVPAAQLETVAGGRVYSRHNIIVGRPSRPTPVVMTALSEINFNPYWNVPASIVERDIIPKMLRGGARKVLTQMNIKVFKGVGGPQVDPERVDWETAIADDYHFRQEPGGSNAMATAKISFPSPFGIYLHDTPEKHLFTAGARFFSSGCVRVEQVQIFLNWILYGQDSFDENNQELIDESRIAELAQSLERQDVKLTHPPQLRVTYLTAWANNRGEVNFRPDIYALDGTGFVLGQPLPVGEVGEGGQRFVLTPVPRQPAAVEEAEFEGFFLFGFRPSNRSGRKAYTTEVERPAATNWTQSKPGVKKKPVKAAAAKTDGKKKQKIATKKKIVKQDEQAATKKKIVKQDEQAAAAEAPAAKQVQPAAKPCTPDIIGDLAAGDCEKPSETTANRD
jgi:murein L,D-transpeptidase YcbB/YkuD